jgi:hypothetical protein
MTRSEAVTRINDALGFRVAGNPIEAVAIRRLQEAQRDLEAGKTLPRFLLQEDQTLLLPAGEHALALPTGFIREDDDNRLHFTSADTNLPLYLKSMRYVDAVLQVTTQQRPDEPQLQTVAPSVYVIRKSTVDFITLADQDYTLIWNYYKADDLLTTDIENQWLANAPEWLIGEAGSRLALDLRDEVAKGLFDEMGTKGRAAVFGDILADEDAGGPLIMGAYL